jgi:hypothetical protein
MDREGGTLWQIIRCSAFIEADINVLFSDVHACGQNCVMLTHDYAVSAASVVN